MTAGSIVVDAVLVYRTFAARPDQSEAWNDLIDCFCVFAMDEIDQVYTWRLQAEEAMKRSGRGGMSSEDLFFRRFSE